MAKQVSRPTGTAPLVSLPATGSDRLAGDENERWTSRYRWVLVALGSLAASRIISTSVLLLSAVHRHLPIFSSHSVLAYDDSAFYISAAIHGYAPHVDVTVKNTTGFFPALPAAIRIVHVLTGLPWTITGVAIDSVLEVAAVIAVAAVTRQVLDHRSAERGVVLLALFPGAYIFTQVYSEPLFLFAAACCLFALHRRWWIVAGVAASLAGATRPTGIILALCCAWVALQEIRARREWRSLIAPILAPTGFITFLVFLWIRTGEALTYVHTQDDAFNQRPTLTAIPEQIRNAVMGTPHRDIAYPVLLTLGIVGTVLLIKLRPRVPAVWIIYSIGGILVNLPSAHVGFRPRFALLTFPLITGLGARLKGRAMILAVAISVAGLIFLSWTLPVYVP